MRRRLVLLVGSVAAMVALAFLVPLSLLVREVARDRALNDAERTVQAVIPLVAVSDDAARVRLSLAPLGENAQKVTVYLATGEVVGAGEARTDAVDLAAREPASFTSAADGGIDVLASARDPSGAVAVVRLPVPDRELKRGVSRAWFALGLVGLALILGATILADRLGRSLVRPVLDLAEAAGRLGRGDLDVSVDPSGPPELSQVGSTFNELVGRVRRLLAAERELVADLSHRLRTPLTAIRLDADAAGPPEVAQQLAADVDALDAAVDEVINEARRGTHDPGRCEVATVALERFTFWSALAAEQDRAATCDIGDDPLPVPMTAAELTAALDALLGNIFSHTPSGTGFKLSADRSAADAKEVWIRVEDFGPGFGDDDISERGTSGGGSTGLGLDIVIRAVEAAGGQVDLRTSDGGGARIDLKLPNADS